MRLVRRALLVAALALTASGLAPAAAAAADGAGDGKALFTQNCAGCHTLGGGDTVGPDLKGVVERTSEEQVRAFIATPEQVLASGDPAVAALVQKFKGVKMPNLGLKPDQVDALVAYLTGGAAGAAGGAGSAGAGGGTTVQEQTGDAAAGKRLFTGETQLANGGPACMSCHSIAGAGALGGGRVGPDLTAAYAKYGGANGVPAVLASLPFPSMQPVYDGHGLGKQEQADLAAFLATTAEKQAPGDATWPLVGIGAGIVAAAGVLALVIWPRRRLVVRRRIAPTPTLTRRR
jgi:mono/diheme cytochrome c family protein